MPISLPLQQMTVEEKLQVMEALWQDLCARAQQVPSPGWHEEMLGERESALERGEDEFEDWERAKQEIDRSIR